VGDRRFENSPERIACTNMTSSVQNATIQTSPLEQNDPMLTLDQLISEATALPDAAQAILIDKVVESMAGQVDRDILLEGVKKAQERLTEIDSGAVQTISGDIALAQIRQLSKK
jgi:Putative addiction module component